MGKGGFGGFNLGGVLGSLILTVVVSVLCGTLVPALLPLVSSGMTDLKDGVTVLAVNTTIDSFISFLDYARMGIGIGIGLSVFIAGFVIVFVNIRKLSHMG